MIRRCGNDAAEGQGGGGSRGKETAGFWHNSLLCCLCVMALPLPLLVRVALLPLWNCHHCCCFGSSSCSSSRMNSVVVVVVVQTAHIRR